MNTKGNGYAIPLSIYWERVRRAARGVKSWVDKTTYTVFRGLVLRFSLYCWHTIRSYFEALAPPDASFFPPSDQFDKTSLCKNLRAAVCPFAQGTPFDSRRIYNCGKTLARRQTAKRWAGFKGIRQGYREKLCPA